MTNTKLEKATQEFMDKIHEMMIKLYGEEPAEFTFGLDVLETDYKLFLRTKEEVEKKPIIDGKQPSAAFKTLMALQTQINTLLGTFGLSPKGRKLIKNNNAEINEVDEEDSELVKFLKDNA